MGAFPEGVHVPGPVAAVEDDRVAVAVYGDAGELAQLVGGRLGRPVGHRVEPAVAVHLLGLSRGVV